MRKILRFLMLILMVAWEAQGHAEGVQIKATAFSTSRKAEQTIGDFKFICSAGKIWERHGLSYSLTDNAYMWQDEDGYSGNKLTKSPTLKIPIGSNLTIECRNGYVIDFIAFSFNNSAGGTDHSKYWKKFTVNGETLDATSCYHPHTQENGSLYNKAWWGEYNGNVTKVTIYDTRTSYGGKKLSDQEQTTGLLWFYIIYHKPNVTVPNVSIDETNSSLTFYGDTGGKVTLSQSNSSDNNKSSVNGIFYTIDGSTPTTSSTRYTSAITGFDRSRKVRAISQCQLKAWQQLKDDGVDDDDDNGLRSGGKLDKKMPEYYNVISSTVEDFIVRKAVSVNLKNSKYATFAHAQNMIVPTDCKAATYKVSSTNSGNARLLAPSHTYNAGDIIAGDNPVVVWRTGSSGSYDFVNTINNYTYESGYTNAFDDKSNNCLSGNDTYDATTATDDGSYFYYLMKEYDTADSRIGFFWATNDGSPALLGAHKAYFKYGSRNSKAKSFLFQLPDTGETTAIGGITTDSPTDDNAPMYNAAGQRVGASYKGLVIQNGRKFIKR